MVGMKLDKTSMEKPKTTVIEVFKIATPNVTWHFRSEEHMSEI